MTGLCSFCNQEKDLTTHHLIAKKYNGGDELTNLIPDICNACHKQIENNIDKNRGDVGAGKISLAQTFTVGSVTAQLTTGSSYLDEDGRGYIDVGSPFYGMSCHIKNVRQKFIEAALSGGSVVLITGSPGNSWLIYSYASTFNV